MAMRDRGTKPDKLTFPFLLKACSRLLALQEGRQIQVEILKHGLATDVYVQNTLIHFYGSCRQISDARQVFDEMSFRTVVSWNSIIKACTENSKIDDSFAIFAEMRSYGVEPDEATMVVLLSACAEVGNLSLGKWVHCQVIEKGIVLNCQLGTALVDMYAKCGALDFARILFDRMIEKNVWTWSAMILGFAQHGLAKEARSGRLTEAYDFIMKMPFEPDPVIFRTLLSACSIHHNVTKRLMELEPTRTGNLVMVANMYADVGSWVEAGIVRTVMRERGLKKVAGESSIEVGGSICRFFSGYDSNIDSDKINHLLDGLNLNMKLIVTVLYDSPLESLD
ncbi:hypothetical protein MKW98_013954 [Papaver atlanticum]|uniref:Pentatricopeptide repeat-containing protein n=1 Tax=Papaver atlanticum TaxID=357466 RepID=A0AAD4XG18_9MAGN|nr:hypothetical protein MKW98_013954 [Papaver atlanticum]